MNFAETLKLALAAIWAHKLRSFLTLLGMIIGVTAFMVVFSVLQGFNSYIDEKIAGIGSNSFTIQRFNFEDFKDTDTIAEAQRRNKEFTMEDIEFLRSRAVVIDKLGAKAGGNRREIKAGAISMEDVTVDGAEPIIGEIEKIDVMEGRYFTDAENNNSMRVAFIGTDVANKLFPQGGAVGEEITIRGVPYRVIGVRVAKGTVFGQPQDAFVQLPLKTFGSNFGGFKQNRYLYFIGTAPSDKLFKDAVDEARVLMRQRRKLAFGEKDTFGIVTPDAISGLRDSLFGTTFIVIMVVPAIALMVGAIVIMNIMLVAVTERTKEIGIRKSLGARQTDILKQFLLEAVTLAIIGGAVGIFLAWIVGAIVTAWIFPTYLSLFAILAALGASGGAGVASGIFPAWKAARLDPIEALRAD